MSAQGTSIFNLSAKAATAIAAYRCVNYNDGQVTVVGGEVKGIAARPAEIGELVDLAVLGTAPAEAGAAIAKGQALMSDALGRVIPATQLRLNDGSLSIAPGATPVTSTAANGAGIVVGAPGVLTGCELPQHLVGYALQAAAGAGAIIEIKLSV